MRTATDKYKDRPERNCVKCGVLFSGFRCKLCASARKKEYIEKNRLLINEANRQWRKENREKQTAATIRWQKANPEKTKAIRKKSNTKRKDKRNADVMRWKAENKDRVKQQWVEWRVKNSEKLKNDRKKRAAEFPEKDRARKHSRRVIQQSLCSRIDPEYVKSLVINQNNKCVYCSTDLIKYQIDHILPIAKGGDNRNDNLQLLCPSCNRRKGAKTDAEYRRYLNALVK